ncbi:MAG: anti-sigma factor family protein [Stellaceae bacterium]
MTTTASCKMVLLAQADFDGELDAAQAAEMEAHRAGCAVCEAAYAELKRTREALREGDLYRRAPADLRRRLATLQGAAPVASPRPQVQWWRRPAANFGLGAAVAAVLVFFILSPGQQGMVDQVVASHVRALQPGHLEDVVSTDQHTVKPWFDGKLDFAPPVKDLADKGFPLKGGRLDYINGRAVAALVYEHGKHPINLFAWPSAGDADRGPAFDEHSGYTLIHWVQNGMTIWVISDLEKAELGNFVQLWRAAF